MKRENFKVGMTVKIKKSCFTSRGCLDGDDRFSGVPKDRSAVVDRIGAFIEVKLPGIWDTLMMAPRELKKVKSEAVCN